MNSETKGYEMKAPQIVIGVVAALALAGGRFAAGMTFDKAQTPSTNTAGATCASGSRGGTGARGHEAVGIAAAQRPLDFDGHLERETGRRGGVHHLARETSLAGRPKIGSPMARRAWAKVCSGWCGGTKPTS